VCASPTSALSNQVHLFVCCLFPNHFQVCCGHHDKKTARSAVLFLDSVTVNTVVHTESEACQKQWFGSPCTPVGAETFVSNRRSRQVSPCLVERVQGILRLGGCVYHILRGELSVFIRRYFVWAVGCISFLVMRLKSFLLGTCVTNAGRCLWRGTCGL